MKRVICGLALLAGVIQTTAIAADSKSPWLGVWRIEQQSEAGQPIIYHLSISSVSPLTLAVFDSGWKEQRTSGLELQAGILRLAWEVGGRQLSASLKCESSRATGTWNFVHPQYEMKGRLEGRKIISESDWRPFDGFLQIQSADGMIDFTGHLIEKAPLDSYDRFLEHWDFEIEPAFYPAVAESLYGSGTFDPNRKAGQLSSLYRKLTNDSFRTRSRQIATLYSSVYSDMKRRFPKLNLRPATVTVPPLEGMPKGIQPLGGLVFLFIDVEEVGRQPELQLRYTLARNILDGAFLHRFRGEDPVLRLLRSGLSTHFTSQLNYSDNRPDYFLVREEAIREVEQNLAKYRAELGRLLSEPQSQDFAGFWGRFPYPGQVLGFHFAGALLEEKPIEEILGMQLYEIYQELRAYLSSGQ